MLMNRFSVQQIIEWSQKPHGDLVRLLHRQSHEWPQSPKLNKTLSSYHHSHHCSFPLPIGCRLWKNYEQKIKKYWTLYQKNKMKKRGERERDAEEKTTGGSPQQQLAAPIPAPAARCAPPWEPYRRHPQRSSPGPCPPPGSPIRRPPPPPWAAAPPPRCRRGTLSRTRSGSMPSPSSPRTRTGAPPRPPAAPGFAPSAAHAAASPSPTATLHPRRTPSTGSRPYAPSRSRASLTSRTSGWCRLAGALPPRHGSPPQPTGGRFSRSSASSAWSSPTTASRWSRPPSGTSRCCASYPARDSAPPGSLPLPPAAGEAAHPGWDLS